MDTHLTIPPQQVKTHTSASTSSSRTLSLMKGVAKITEATALAFAGVTLIAAGAYSAHTIYTEVNDFYFGQGEQANGFSSMPFFDSSCHSISDYLHQKTGYPEKNSTFCEDIGSKAFDQLDPESKLPALIIPLASATLLSFASLYATLGGIALLGHSVQVYTSAIFG